MTNLPPITDHEFARLVKHRCEDMSRSMAEIAEELGSTPDELCRWIMKYREPKKLKPYLNRMSPAQVVTRTPQPHHDLTDDAQRFENWRRAKEGAAAARRALA